MSLTISEPGVLRGSRQPRLKSVPPWSSTAGHDAVEYAASVGLVLDGWQSDVMVDAMGERGAGWTSFEVGITVPRQNGKGALLEARELAGIELWGDRLIMHTAHELKTTEEAHLRMERICEACPDLDRQVKSSTRSNGKESMTFKNGARIKYIARSERSGRGFAGVDLIIMDEDMFLSSSAMDALIPTLATSRSPQVWYTGSAGVAVSSHKRLLQTRAATGTDPSLAYFEWSVPDDWSDLDDHEAWYLANPGLGVRVSEDFVRNERATLSAEGFARERLGIWTSEGGQTVISKESWSKLADPSSVLSEPAVLAVDVNPIRTVATIAAASGGHVEVLENRAGVAWVAERVGNLCRERRIRAVVFDSAGPAGGLKQALQAQNVPLVELSGREYGQACGEFFDAVAAGQVSHRGQEVLAAAVEAGRKRQSGDTWTWHRRDAKADITSLVAVTLAHHLAHRVEQPKGLTRVRGRTSAY